MSRLVARILLSIFMFPLAGLLYMMCIVVGLEISRWVSGFRAGDGLVFLASGVITWVGVATYWILLWRQGVPWTPWRVRHTCTAAALAAVVGAGGGLLLGGLLRNSDSDFAIFVGSVLSIMLWLVATVLIWRETPAERSARVRGVSVIICPTCGYNLTGLTETRCPECGSHFTLNELIASQPQQAAAEME